jgi:hypothetical protein
VAPAGSAPTPPLGRVASDPFWGGRQTEAGVNAVLDELEKVDFAPDAEYAFVEAGGKVYPCPNPPGRERPITIRDDPRESGVAFVRVASGGRRLTQPELLEALRGALLRTELFCPKED